MKSLSQTTQKWFLYYGISQSLLQLDKVLGCGNNLLVGCSRIQELMSKIFAGLTGRCQHPSLHTKYIISTTKPAVENWRIQIQVPERPLCLVSAINVLTAAHTEDCNATTFLPFMGREFIQWQIRVSRGWRADSLGFALSQSISNSQGF